MQTDLFKNMRTSVGNFVVSEIVDNLDPDQSLDFQAEEKRADEKFTDVESTIGDGLLRKTEGLLEECLSIKEETLKKKMSNDYLEQDLKDTLAEIAKAEAEIKHLRLQSSTTIELNNAFKREV